MTYVVQAQKRWTEYYSKRENNNAVEKREGYPAADNSTIFNDSSVHLNHIPQSFHLKKPEKCTAINLY